MRLTDEEFRAALDENGLLLPGALEPPRPGRCFRVFAQRPDARVEAAQWERHAASFFGARLGLAVPKRYGPAGFPAVDVAAVVLAPPGGAGTRHVLFGRPREPEDLDEAERADIAQGSAGLGALARRCATVWCVPAEHARDKDPLLLAAILASVVLGPILEPDGTDLFGVRTARAKLERLTGS